MWWRVEWRSLSLSTETDEEMRSIMDNLGCSLCACLSKGIVFSLTFLEPYSWNILIPENIMKIIFTMCFSVNGGDEEKQCKFNHPGLLHGPTELSVVNHIINKRCSTASDLDCDHTKVVCSMHDGCNWSRQWLEIVLCFVGKTVFQSNTILIQVKCLYQTIYVPAWMIWWLHMCYLHSCSIDSNNYTGVFHSFKIQMFSGGKAIMSTTLQCSNYSRSSLVCCMHDLKGNSATNHTNTCTKRTPKHFQAWPRDTDGEQWPFVFGASSHC